MLVASCAGFRGRPDLIEYVDRELEAQMEASEDGYPADEHLDSLVTVLVLGEVLRSLWMRLSAPRRTRVPVFLETSSWRSP